MKRDISLSMEFFPPKTQQGLATLKHTLESFLPLSLDFASVTFGAGGASQDATADTVASLVKSFSVPIVPHLSSIGMSDANIRLLLNHYQALGCDRMVLLRGDKPSGLGVTDNAFRYASDLVEFVRKVTQDYFTIYVAAYTEGHPEATTLKDDVLALRKKVYAGADIGITQYFYHADSYHYFLERCNEYSIDIPIIPGVMPVHNFESLLRSSKRFGAELPRWLVQQMSCYEGDTESQRELGLDIVARLCDQLLSEGAPGLHIYSLNQAELTSALFERLSLTSEELLLSDHVI